MKPNDLSDQQKQALMDLLVLGMYADHNLASAEEACVTRLLDTFGFASDYERQAFCDEAFTRTRRHSDTPEAIRAYVTVLAATFPTGEVRQRVYDLLDGLLTSDEKVTSEESQLLAALRDTFQL